MHLSRSSTTTTITIIFATVMLLLQHVNAFDFNDDNDDNVTPVTNTNPHSGGNSSTTIIATALVIVSCAPILFVIIIHLLNICKAACTQQDTTDRNDDDSYISSTHMRESIIRNLLREDNQNFVLRRAVLEKFFSDVSKCLTAKDLLAAGPLKTLSSFSSSSDDDNDNDDDDSSNNDEGDIESGLKCDTKEDTKPSSSSKGETPSTPRTLCVSDHSTDTDTDGDSSGCDQHEHEGSPILRRSLIQDSDNSNNDDDDDCDMEVIALCNNDEGEILSKGGEEATKYNDNDALERGAHEQQEDTESDNICPICLDKWDEGDFIIESKHCSHQFHKSCILLWLEKSDQCPCCRAQMITEEEVQATALSVVGTQRMFSAINELTMQHSDLANI